jgi:photosystem II stability/assembly factor-like uncharacterized protein
MNPKRLFLFLFSAILLLSSCRKDLLHWQSVEQIQTASNIQFNNAIFLPSGLGIVCGGWRFDKAKILISTDKGASWQSKAMPDNSIGLFGACASPNNTLYFSGMYMNLCSSKDGMSNFKYQALSGREEFISAISFGENQYGVGVTTLGTDSGAVIRFDSAHNLISFQRFQNALWDIKMFDAKTGFAVGSGLVMKTQDGGINWERLAATGDNFNSISALDSNRLFVCGLSGFIIKTTDGGKTWRRLRNGSNITLPDYQLWDLCFINAQQGYAVGEKGLVLFTDDGGDHWMEFDRFTTNNLRFICLCPDGKLITGGENGALYRLQPK